MDNDNDFKQDTDKLKEHIKEYLKDWADNEDHAYKLIEEVRTEAFIEIENDIC